MTSHPKLTEVRPAPGGCRWCEKLDFIGMRLLEASVFSVQFDDRTFASFVPMAAERWQLSQAICSWLLNLEASNSG
jgi:hypothetical protein